MHINVSYPYFQTALFVGLLIATVVLTAKKDHAPHAMNHTHTNELKGVAILMVLFSHIGYFLFSDHTFLYPLSVAGGLGVNIFLFLSGFGLASSSAAAEKSLWHFYIKRFLAIFVPMWMVLFATLLADFYLQGRTYDLVTIVQSVVGFFPNADLSSAINSPLLFSSLFSFLVLGLFEFIY
jgi:peptidoglycan/LPS O-acetylase OafA/YrhL